MAKSGLFGRSAEFLRYSSLGLEMGIAMIIGLLIGMGLDRWLHTKPWLTIVFFLFGVVAGFKNVFELMKREQKENQTDDRKRDDR